MVVVGFSTMKCSLLDGAGSTPEEKLAAQGWQGGVRTGRANDQLGRSFGDGALNSVTPVNSPTGRRRLFRSSILVSKVTRVLLSTTEHQMPTSDFARVQVQTRNSTNIAMHIAVRVDGVWWLAHASNPSDPLNSGVAIQHTLPSSDWQQHDLTLAGYQWTKMPSAISEAGQGQTDIIAHNDERGGMLGPPEDRRGYGFSVGYAYRCTRQTPHGDKLWQIDTAGDDSGNSATFHYHTQMQGGRYAISQIDWPNNTSTTYAYTDGFLSQVNHPDGSVSTFSRSDPVTNLVTVNIADAAGEGTHRNKTVLLTTNYTFDNGASNRPGSHVSIQCSAGSRSLQWQWRSLIPQCLWSRRSR